MLSRVVRRRLVSAAQRSRFQPGRVLQRRWNSPAPKPGDGPLMSRRADRELPDVSQVSFRWGRTLPIFLAIVTACSIAIFNYQKTSSPVIASTLYALRTNPRARELLGDEIYFNRQIPWIHGEMNQLKGRIDVWFDVKGSKAKGTMRFSSFRRTPRGMFETTEWSLKTEDGEVVDLLEEGDPFAGLAASVPVESMSALEDMEDAGGRGYRQQSPYK